MCDLKESIGRMITGGFCLWLRCRSARVFVLLAFALARTGNAAQAAWHEEPGFRWASLEEPPAGRIGFTPLSAGATGLSFTNVLSESSIAANRVLANGSGVAVGDFDNDGLPDIYLCGLESPNALYKNLGNWKFVNVAAQGNVECAGKLCRGAVFADINGDRALDLLVSTVNDGVLCFVNDGTGTFSDATTQAGTRSSYAAMTMTLADIDGNGTLDLYVSNNRPDDIRDLGRVRMSVVNGKPAIPAQFRNRLLFHEGRVAEYGQPDQLYLNDGKGRFDPVEWSTGAFVDELGKPLSAAPLDWGLAAAFRDVNGDSAPDLYVCNDFWTPDRFWINDGHGRFRAIDPLAQRKTSASSMGVDFADLDRDGDVDFFVVDMLSRDPAMRKRQGMADQPETTPIGVIDNRPQVMRNTLFQNRGDGTFAEVAAAAGLTAADWAWSPNFLDVDLDGFEDLLISAGHFRDVQDMDAEMQIKAQQHSWAGFKNEAERQKAFTQELLGHNRLYPLLRMPIVAFRNSRDWTFQETTKDWGFDREQVWHGMALADFDGDGDLDLVANSLNDAAGLFRNEASGGRVVVRLQGRVPNTMGIGATVRLLGGAVPVQVTEMVSGGRYLSGSEARVVLASGKASGGMSLEILWRSGLRSVVSGVLPNRIYEMDEPAARAPLESGAPGAVSTQSAFFEDVSANVGHRHVDGPFDDFERQPLLPFRLSRQGPGVGWFDLDADGHEDLIVGAGNGGVPAVFLSDGAGRFTSVAGFAPVTSDTSGIAAWNGAGGKGAVLVGLSGYEVPAAQGAMTFELDRGRARAGEPVAAEMTGGSAVAVGDPNGDGRMVLFVGGGVVPGGYPLGAPSKLYRFVGDRWQIDSRNSGLFDRLGVVNGAVWSDLTGDGRSELVLACEWGPIRVFQSRDGLFFDLTRDLGLAGETGWWKGVATGDFDGDGRLDIVASNWGWNSPYRASHERPLVFTYGQLARPGVTDVVETDYDLEGRLTPRHSITTLASSLPFLFEQFANHRAYSEASLDLVLGARKALGRTVEITTLASTLFMNRGTQFESRALPAVAQNAPAFGINVGDLDGDGHEDVFLSQNFFATRPEMPRMDAGLGLWLRGDGAGGLTEVFASESGIRVYGEGRGSALGDFDRDGRVDLVVTQNGADTRVFRNVGAKPGLSVRLKGATSNPFGVGAVIRLQFGDAFGPAREVHAGSGYWSQDSLIQVLGYATGPSAVWVRWPGGKTTSTPVPAGIRSLTIDAEGRAVESR
jgi:enediyne biosynthesis protein E4